MQPFDKMDFTGFGSGQNAVTRAVETHANPTHFKWYYLSLFTQMRCAPVVARSVPPD